MPNAHDDGTTANTTNHDDASEVLKKRADRGGVCCDATRIEKRTDRGDCKRLLGRHDRSDDLAVKRAKVPILYVRRNRDAQRYCIQCVEADLTRGVCYAQNPRDHFVRPSLTTEERAREFRPLE